MLLHYLFPIIFFLYPSIQLALQWFHRVQNILWSLRRLIFTVVIVRKHEILPNHLQPKYHAFSSNIHLKFLWNNFAEFHEVSSLRTGKPIPNHYWTRSIFYCGYKAIVQYSFTKKNCALLTKHFKLEFHHFKERSSKCLWSKHHHRWLFRINNIVTKLQPNIRIETDVLTDLFTANLVGNVSILIEDDPIHPNHALSNIKFSVYANKVLSLNYFHSLFLFYCRKFYANLNTKGIEFWKYSIYFEFLLIVLADSVPTCSSICICLFV